MITIKLDWFVYDHKSLCKNSRDIFLPLDMWQVWPYYDIVKQVIYFISVFVCDMSSSRIWITILKGATACNFICFIITEHSYQKSTVFTMYSSTELCCIVPTSQCVTMPPPPHPCLLMWICTGKICSVWNYYSYICWSSYVSACQQNWRAPRHGINASRTLV